MNHAVIFLAVMCLLPTNSQAQAESQAKSSADQPALTIYNANFAVVRQIIPLDLKTGTNRVSYTDATAHIEPDSVILRDPTGRRMLQILEQNYRNDPVSQELLLSINEGKTIDFRVQRYDAQGQVHNEIVQGKIVRSGYVPHYSAMSQYGQQYAQQQMSYASNTSQPIIEVDGKLQFTLPGLPLFPTLGDNTILKPTLDWVLQTDKPGPSTAELSYVTGGMSWHADYNVIAPPKGDTLDLVGWITMDNQSGKEFDNARIKLMAGDVNKVQSADVNGRMYAALSSRQEAAAPPVTEKAFDEYHLYTLERSTTLHDRETKQVQFVSATGVKSQRIYVYNGAAIDNNRYSYYNYEQIRNDQNYGTQSNPKVWVMQEFKNSKANNLGMPLPKGRLRFYRRDDDGQVEFTGENVIDHTPSDETIRVYTGNAFDIVGERRRTNYRLDTSHNSLDEAFEIKVRNHKKEAVEVRIVEKLYRWITWDSLQKSDLYKKLDSQTIEFRVQIPPDGEKVVTYSAHYSW
jgi:hypothetical protein